MPFKYEILPSFGPLRQGELLSGFHELKPRYPPVEPPLGTEIFVDPLPHPVVVVMTSDCDLVQDYRARFPGTAVPGAPADLATKPVSPNWILNHILLCDVFTENEIRKTPISSSDIWRRIGKNQDERYHKLESLGRAGEEPDDPIDYYLDFKRTFSASPEGLYEALRQGLLHRLGLVPPIYVHDLIHRFHSFLARVSLPEW